MKSRITWLLLLCICFIFQSSDLRSYELFTAKGKVATYKDLVKEASKVDVVLFGELHNSAIAHWLQVELTKSLAEENKNLILGAEMFEADDQVLLDEYLGGLISERNFEKESKLWDNYSTDYKPLVTFAKANKLPFIATNIPRRYASRVAYEGPESLADLSEEAKNWICPLPLIADSTLPGYNNLLHLQMGPHANSEYFMYAQAVKDATMAHFIAENRADKSLFLHFNGAYHSNNFEGISWYLKKRNPKIRILTVSCVEGENLDELTEEEKESANFIIKIDQDVTKTY